MKYGDELLIRVGGGKGYYYDSLTKYLQTLAQGFFDRFQRDLNLQVFIADGAVPDWSESRTEALRRALDAVWAWPRPGTVASEGTAWSGWDDEHYDLDDPDRYSDFYRKSTPASRKAFVEAARGYIQERTA